jgi:hypothetical protein
MTRSAMALAFGAWMGVEIASIPIRPSALSELAAIDGIPIAEQMAGFLVPGRGLDELPPHPGCGRVGRHVDMHELAPAVGDEHQHMQRLERQRGHAQQIGGPQMVSMVAQERAPGLR